VVVVVVVEVVIAVDTLVVMVTVTTAVDVSETAVFGVVVDARETLVRLSRMHIVSWQYTTHFQSSLCSHESGAQTEQNCPRKIGFITFSMIGLTGLRKIQGQHGAKSNTT
jgi:hypothetical protein